MNMFKLPSAPAPTPPPPMPDPMSPAVLEARRRAAAQANQIGRVSTIMTQGGSVVGGGGTAAAMPPYSGRSLG